MEEQKRIILVTGAAGFIGFHLCKRLLELGYIVVGLDNLNPYYDVSLKKARLKLLIENPDFHFYKQDIQDHKALIETFNKHRISIICNLAAQAGVRHSLKDPFSYEKSNLKGFLNLLEMAKNYDIENFVYASSSSVYGGNKKRPFSEKDRVDQPLSLYGATKRANELMAYAYHHLYGIPCTGLRYFTVYGPWGRPDMALFLFTKAILNNKPINVFNYGRMKRDFTYIDDVIDGTVSAINRVFDYEIFNIGNANTVELFEFIKIIEQELGMEARKVMMPLQAGDVLETSADIEHSKEKLGYNPKTPLKEGIRRFIQWYREYYRV